MATQAEKDGRGSNGGGQGDRRRHRFGPLAAEVPALTKAALGKKGFAEASLIAEWPSIVGADYSGRAIPMRLRFPRRSGKDLGGATLVLRATSAAALELQHLKPKLLERINAYFGYGAIAEIKLELGDARPARPGKGRTEGPPGGAVGAAGARALGAVADPELQEILRRLGTRMKPDR
jgi:hypothetical protein